MTFRSQFSASTSRHGGAPARRHGHAYEVEVDTISTDWLLGAALDAVVAELDARELEDMMPGASTDLDEIPSWIMERLLLAHQGITEVRVTEIGSRRVTASVIRPLRAPVRG